MVKDTKAPSTDEHLFQQAMRDVSPLKTKPRADSGRPTKPRRAGERPAAEPVTPVLSTFEPHTPDEDGSSTSYRKNGVQNRLLQRLKRGHFPPADQLDLHHMTASTAHTALHDFIADAQNRRLKCIRLIHGKGLRSNAGPVLKNMVHQALREHDATLAFTSCKPADGGSGAVDVLLRLT